jgi:aspartate carbamoyltransferase catalytic subunit
LPKKKETNTFLILHPLPRNDELALELDNEPYSGYFKAMNYSVYLRGILIRMVLENTMN